MHGLRESWWTEEQYLAGPRFKTVTVVGEPGRFGWSERLRKGENCVVARWEGGDLISEGNLRLILEGFAEVGRTTRTQSVELFDAIARLDVGKGRVDDLDKVRALARILGIRVVRKAKETPLPRGTLEEHNLAYWQAYRAAQLMKKSAIGAKVQVRRIEGRPRFPAGTRGSKDHLGGYFVRVTPAGAARS